MPIDCLSIALDAHMLSHNGYGPFTCLLIVAKDGAAVYCFVGPSDGCHRQVNDISAMEDNANWLYGELIYIQTFHGIKMWQQLEQIIVLHCFKSELL